MIKKGLQKTLWSLADDVHWFWVSVEAFPEFGEKSIQHAAIRHWNVFIPHAIRPLSYNEYDIPYSHILHCNLVSEYYLFKCILILTNHLPL